MYKQTLLVESKGGARTIQRIEEAGEDSNPTVRVIEALAGALGLAAAALTQADATVMGEAVAGQVLTSGAKIPLS